MAETVTIRIRSTGGKQTVQALKSVSDTMKKVEESISTTSIEVARSADEQKTFGDALIKTALTLSKVHLAYEVGKIAIKGWTSATAGATAATKANAAGSAVMAAGMTKVRNATLVLTPALAATAAAVTALGIGAAAGVAIVGLGTLEKKILEIAKAGAAIRPIRGALDNLTAEIDTTSEALLDRLAVATERTVPRVQLMKNAVLALNSEAVKSPDDLALLARAARELGQVMGRDAAPAMQSLIRGIALQNTGLIKNATGVLVTAEEAYQRYADAIGKSVSELDSHEKKVAFTQGVLQKLSESLNRVENDAGDLNIAFQQAGTAAQDMRDRFSEGVAESDELGKSVLGLRDALSQFSKDAGLAAEAGEAIADAFGIALNKALEATPFLGQQIEEMRERREQLEQIAASVESVAGGRFEQLLPESPTAAQIREVETFLKRTLIGGIPADLREELGAELETAISDVLAGLRPPIPEIQFGEIERAIQLEPTRANLEAVTDRVEKLRREAAKLEIDSLFRDTSEELGEVRSQLDVLMPELIAQFRTAAEEMRGTNEELERLVDTLTVGAPAAEMFADPVLKIAAGLEEDGFLQLLGPAPPEIGRPRDEGAGVPSGRQLIEDLRRFGITPEQAQAGFLPAGVTPDDLDAAREALERQREVEEEWKEFLGLAGDEINETAQVAITGFGNMAEAAIRGMDQIEVTIINSLTRVAQQAANIELQRQLQEGASSLGFLPFAGPAIGAVGGILSAVFSGADRRPQRTTLVDIERPAHEKMREASSGPDSVQIVIVDSRGNEISRVRQRLKEHEARDGVTRLPAGASSTLTVGGQV